MSPLATEVSIHSELYGGTVSSRRAASALGPADHSIALLRDKQSLRPQAASDRDRAGLRPRWRHP
jgi:hypothetical protein